MTKKNKILISLALIWGFLLIYHLASPSGFFYLGGEGTGNNIEVKEALNVESLQEINLADIKKKDKYKKTSTDLFYKPYKKPKPKPTKKPCEINPKLCEELKPVVIEKTPLELFIEEVKFAGFVKKTGTGKAFFIDYNEEIFIVKQGDLIVQRYKIISVTEKKVYFVDVKTKEQDSILIGE